MVAISDKAGEKTCRGLFYKALNDRRNQAKIG
jgi:hypothetical protein